MSKDMHLYSLGQDPFILPMGDVTVYIHQGSPPVAPPAPSGPSASPGLFVPTKLNPLYETYIQAPTSPEVLGRIIDEQDVSGVELGMILETIESQDTYNQLKGIIEGLGQSHQVDVSIHVAKSGDLT